MAHLKLNDQFDLSFAQCKQLVGTRMHYQSDNVSKNFGYQGHYNSIIFKVE